MNHPIKLESVNSHYFSAVYNSVLENNERVNKFGSRCRSLQHRDSRCFLSSDRLSGFVVNRHGELCHLFSLSSGRGDYLIKTAIKEGANSLNCYDGYLVGLYSRFGFKEIHRVANYDHNGPDVVYMSLVKKKNKLLTLLNPLKGAIMDKKPSNKEDFYLSLYTALSVLVVFFTVGYFLSL